jgi:cytoskeleton protein RodZ
MTLGAYLKSEREARGISLQEIVRETKIGLRMLEAIEADQFDQLPDGHFKIAFLKSYARQIGLDAEKILAEFHLAQGVVSTEMPIVRESLFSSKKNERLKNRISLAVGSLVVLGLICYLMFWGNASRHLFRQDTLPSPLVVQDAGTGHASSPPAISPPAGNAAPGNASPAPAQAPASSQPGVANSSAGPPSQPGSGNLKVLGELVQPSASLPAKGAEAESSPARGLSLRVDITEKSWISVTAGETTLFTGLLEAGNAQTFRLDKTLKMVIGNAGGVRLSAGGKGFLPLGRSGEVRTLQISAENYLQYVMPAPFAPGTFPQ